MMASCSSSVSLQKSTKTDDNRSKSCDTVCTSNSSCFLQKRKPNNPLMYSLRPNYPKTSSSAVRQRVLSAKLLKLRSIQNQLNDANYHLSELSKENQVLKNLQKRQDKALSKYESTNADLPRLIHSHEEQLRVLTEKNKSQRKTIRELSDMIKMKEEELLKTQEKLNHLEKLNKDKRLLDKEKLLDQIDNLKLKLQKSDEQVAVLNRKLMLESKISKQRLNSEILKHKQCQKQLGQALDEIDRLTGLLESKENTVHPRKQRLSRSTQRQSNSMTALSRTRSSEKSSSSGFNEELHSKTPITDVKLEPIKCRVEETHSDILNVPSENVKNRLSSSASTRSKSSDEVLRSGSENSINNQESINAVEDSIIEFTKNLDVAIEKATENSTSQFEHKIADYCSDILENVWQCNDRIEIQKESLKILKSDTNTLKESFEKTKKLESKLRTTLLKDDKSDMDFINELFAEDLKIELQRDKSENMLKKGPKVKPEDRRKLLATLKAIDNGDSVDGLQDKSSDMRRELLDATK